MKTSALDTPMMRQYLAIKAEHPDSIVFYRMGDFYEMFLEDAELAAPLLDIALTTRDKGKPDAVPMCGIPVHSADQYVKELARLGHRIAVCEQVEDARETGGKRLVRREVVEVVTPGLVGDPAGLDGKEVVAIAAISLATDISSAAGDSVAASAAPAGLAVLDASTGDFRATRVDPDAAGESIPAALLEELMRIAPREILVAVAPGEAVAAKLARLLPDSVLRGVPDDFFEPSAVSAAPEGFDRREAMPDTRAAAALLRYLGENQPSALRHLPRLRDYTLSESVILDAATRAHLELLENSEDRGRRGTLIALLDRTRTALGARRLARWVGYPLKSPDSIRDRQDAVAWLAESDGLRSRLREALGEVRDLERILAKAVRPFSVPRDLGLLRASLCALPEVVAALEVECERAAGEPDAVADPSIGLELGPPALIVPPEPLPELATLLCEGLVDDPPVIAKGSRGANESGYIRAGFRPELDAIHESAEKGREWIAGLEASERERTGINNLKVRYHPVHGYSLEVPKTQLAKVPEDYTRKQTLASVERFSTEALSEIEATVMGANERAAGLEREIFESLREAVVAAAEPIRAAAERVAELDALASLAEVGRRERWIRPEVDEGERIEIEAGRHPVVEALLRARSGDGYVPNDTLLDSADQQIMLLTGPNMSGKSTYLRQVALITLMAQIGSFVPAEAARIGVVDRIFTRVGASDRLSFGESTFMVEMRETAEILNLASRRSLIILDEIGRGTSTFDGLSIAWAVAEYLHDTKGLEARTLFATHYHELIELANQKPRLVNAHFEVREWKDEVVFLRRLIPGGASRSYGIQVAQLAGLPASVVTRARSILAGLEGGETGRRAGGVPELEAGQSGAMQLPLALGAASDGASRIGREILSELEDFDPDATRPIDALMTLARWHARMKEESR